MHVWFLLTVVNDEVVKFMEAAKRGNMVALSRCIFCDHLTPLLAYRCLVKEDDRDAPSFLFESVEQGSHGTNVVSTDSYEFILLLEFFSCCFSPH